ncbi:kinase-like domain-containing protein [Infundibulicybe gibba]|nr:kinase-like domain-containing protein [Infundibulicybe gibba]
MLTPAKDNGLPDLDPECLNHGTDASNEFIEEGYLAFWMSYKDYLAFRGYTFYETIPWRTHESFRPLSLYPPPPAHPYAVACYDPSKTLNTTHPSGLRFCAQDSSHRDVVIRLVGNDTEEYRIHTLLSTCQEIYTMESFPSIIPTIEIIPSPYNFSFIVTPRWGRSPADPDFTTVYELLYFIKSILCGLTFLHSCRIVHRDIDWKNILINHFSYNHSFGHKERIPHRASQQARYCLFDFDISLIVPIGTDRLPAELSMVGSPWHHPGDTHQGEFDYDPFAYDVACMGIMLSRFNYLVPTIPLLAPLLDRMTTHVVEHRFTASNALEFCEFIMENLPQSELKKVLPRKPTDGYPRVVDRWEKLPVDFARAWSAYRETPLSYRIHILRWIGDWQLGWRLLRWVRRTLRI